MRSTGPVPVENRKQNPIKMDGNAPPSICFVAGTLPEKSATFRVTL
jgi:hypothetical protein